MISRLMALALAALVLSLSPSALSQVDTLPGDVYSSGSLVIRPHAEAGCPASTCARNGALAVGTDRVLCICYGGAWGAVGASGSDLTAHLTDTVDAHDASAISVLDTGDNYAGSDVEAILAELPGAIQGLVDVVAGALSDHIADTTAAHAASAISVLDTGDDYAATDVEAALAEVIAGAQDAYGLADSAATAAGSAQSTADAAIPKSLATAADQYLYSTGSGAWAAGTAGASTILGQGAAGGLTALSASDARTVLDVATTGTVATAQSTADGAASAASAAQNTADAAIAKGVGTVAHQIARTDGASSWTASTIAENSIVGRPTGGTIGSLTPAQARTAAGLDATADGGGAALIGADTTGRTYATGATIDAQLDAVDTALGASSGTPSPVLLGIWAPDNTWERDNSTAYISYTGSDYSWAGAGRAIGVYWPYTRLWAAHSAGWGVELRCWMSAGATNADVRMDCTTLDATPYCVEQAKASWGGVLVGEEVTWTFASSLPTSPTYLFWAFHGSGAGVRLYQCAIYAYPL